MAWMRPFVWLLVAFVVTPILDLAVGFFTMPDSMELPAASIATFFLYLFAADLGWSLAGRWTAIGAVAGAGAILVMAYGVPAGANAAVVDRSRSATASDSTPSLIKPPKVVALLTPRKERGGKAQVETDCTKLCQRLLYWGNRKAVLMGATPASERPEDASKLIRYSIERRAACPQVDVPQASVMPGQWQVWGEYPTSAAVRRRIGGGQCLMARPGAIAEADLAAVMVRPARETLLSATRRAGSVASWQSSIYVRSAGKWARVGRNTQGRYSLADAPLRLARGGYMSFKLASKEARKPPSKALLIEHALAPWLGWPEGLPGGRQGPPAAEGSPPPPRGSSWFSPS